jgi:hypothetical protein
MKNLSSSTKIIASVVVTLSATMLPFAAIRATEPVTKCITAKSKAANDTAVARLEKDVAPYLKTDADAAAIKAYRDALTVAWSALEQPYCGYGAEGAASAIKSFGKSADRARTAFLDSIKNHAPVKTVVAVAKEDSEPTSTPDGPTPSMAAMMAVEPTKKAEPVAVAKTTITTSAKIRSGLRRGMRAASVLDMQKCLAKHFGVSPDDIATGFFGPKTESLIIKFQLEKKIIKSASEAGAGLVGPKTATALNSL